ncbi:MAG: nuclear transport factor 2 family protein [Gammaproteobacteria bacterium]
MNKNTKLRMLAFGAATLLPGMAFVQGAPKLTPQDYIEIQELTGGYPYKIDHCTNSGYDYADMYTDDATFGVSSAWESPSPKIWYRGREELANAGGGGKGGCRARRATPNAVQVHHIVTSQTIIPTATGARGISTLLATGAGGNKYGIEWQGGYEDTYVKTPKGWKFKSRLHTWPDHDWPNTAAEQGERFKAEAARAAAEAAKANGGTPPAPASK